MITSPYFILSDHGGLGNRLGPILSGVSVNEKVNARIRFFWGQDETCDIPFGRLFDSSLTSLSVEEICEIKPYLFLQTGNIMNFFPELQKKMIGGKNYSGEVRKFGPRRDLLAQEALQKLRGGESVFVDTSHPLRLKECDFSHFPRIFSEIISGELLSEALKIKDKLGLNKNVIGCHMRGTDKGQRLDNKGRIDVWRGVLAAAEANKDKKFFVCSDEKRYEDKVAHCKNIIKFDKTSYPTLIKQRTDNRSWQRNIHRGEQSVVEALMDMCCLSFCDLSNAQLAPRRTTFVGTARLISGWEVK